MFDRNQAKYIEKIRSLSLDQAERLRIEINDSINRVKQDLASSQNQVKINVLATSSKWLLLLGMTGVAGTCALYAFSLLSAVIPLSVSFFSARKSLYAYDELRFSVMDLLIDENESSLFEDQNVNNAIRMFEVDDNERYSSQSLLKILVFLKQEIDKKLWPSKALSTFFMGSKERIAKTELDTPAACYSAFFKDPLYERNINKTIGDFLQPYPALSPTKAEEKDTDEESIVDGIKRWSDLRA